MDIEARLSLLEAERGILRTMYAYAHAIDYGDEEGWLACFTDDAVFDVRGGMVFVARGKDELREMIGRHTRAPGAWHKHLMVQPFIDIDDGGDTASVRSFFTVLRDDGGAPTVGVFGRYVDRLAREADGTWRFAERIAEVEVWRSDLPRLVQPASG